MSSHDPFRIFAAMISMTIAACTYDASFGDCAISCSAASGCPDDLSCGTEGLCRPPGPIEESCATILSDAGPDAPGPSCDSLGATCGPTASDDCCATATTIPGGTFFRSYDVSGDGMFSNMGYPATVSAFRLDKYEVTVGRFRKFVAAGNGTQASAPAMGAGSRTLNGMAAQGGWNASWNDGLAMDTATLIASLKSDALGDVGTWTDAADVNDNLPMNVLTWREAMAFCIWDGGYLPTEVEWNFAVAGGDEQRAYAWSSPADSMTIDCSYANYNNPAGTYCVNGTSGAANRVGSESPKGDGRWGHSDLAGNVWEWTLDWYANAYVTPCTDCANLTSSGGSVRGGGFSYAASDLRGAARNGNNSPSFRSAVIGVRCAREPQ